MTVSILNLGKGEGGNARYYLEIRLFIGIIAHSRSEGPIAAFVPKLSEGGSGVGGNYLKLICVLVLGDGVSTTLNG